MVNFGYADEITADAVVDWLGDPVNRRLIPADPGVLISALRTSASVESHAQCFDEHDFDMQHYGQPTEQVQSARIDVALQLVDQLLKSSDADTRMSAAFLFGAILVGGGANALKDMCDQSEAGQILWAAFIDSLSRYAKLIPAALRMQMQQPVGGATTVQKTLTVIVHGTLAAGEDWWRETPGQKNFWDYINSETGNCVRQGREFSWSGGLTDGERRQGARIFLNWWQTQGRPRLRVVAHSHGGNVVWYAAALDPTLAVDSMISLGTPICVDYPLRLKQIKRIDNVYSEHDIIQTAGATLTGKRGEGRTLPDSDQVTNYHVPKWDPAAWAKSVGHTDLHQPLVWRENHLNDLL